MLLLPSLEEHTLDTPGRHNLAAFSNKEMNAAYGNIGAINYYYRYVAITKI
jgi:hypothetical protein